LEKVLISLYYHYVTEFAWLVEPEGMPAIDNEADGGNDE